MPGFRPVKLYVALASAVAVPLAVPLKAIKVPTPLEIGVIDPEILMLLDTAVAVKSIPVIEAPLTVTVRLAGVNA